MPRTLDVYFSGLLAGRLTQDDSGQLSFAYDPSWLAAAHSSPLSQSLPLRAEPFDHRASRPFFAGLLPEGEKRDSVAHALGITPRNDFGLLVGIGGECAGAITLLPAGSPPPAPPGPGDYQPLNDSELANVLRTLPDRPLLAGREGVRLSLAGAQDKLPVLVVGSSVALPLHGAPSSHIVKPAVRRFQGTVENEAFCLLLAKRLGLHVIEAEIRHAEVEPYLLVARYDRQRTDDDALKRLHQEDFCQALGVAPELKYQSEGGPSLAQCFELVRNASTRPVLDLGHLLDFVVFNALIGNHDAHGKNYSLLYTDQAAELAPLYDALSTAVYPELSPRMAMKVGNKHELSEIMPRHWDAFARECGLSAPMVRRRVIDLATRIPAAAAESAKLLAQEGHGSPLVERIVSLLSQRSISVQRSFEADQGPKRIA